QRGVDALLAGTAVADELGARLATEKERKAALTAELAAIRAPRGQHGPAVAAPLLAALRASARHIRAVLGQDIPRTRQILRRLLVGRLDCSAFNEGGRVGYRFAGRGSYAKLAPEASRHVAVVAAAGVADLEIGR